MSNNDFSFDITASAALKVTQNSMNQAAAVSLNYVLNEIGPSEYFSCKSIMFGGLDNDE